MKKILIVLMVCVGLGASAQEVYTSSGRPANAKKKEERKKGFDVSRLVVGGGLGIGIGSVTTLGISPIIGYRITDKFAAGVGFGYQYLKAKDYFQYQDLDSPFAIHTYDLKASTITTSVWARYLILTNLFAHVEYEHNFSSYNDVGFATNGSGQLENRKIKYDVPALLVGVGFRQPISENSSLFIMGMYDVLQREMSPYRGGIFPRIGFTIGF
jgi:hypothetical protein